MKILHHYSADFKLKHLGYGEWVEEPDFAEFEEWGFSCIVARRIFKEIFCMHEHYSGGNFCGYIKIPPEHPWYDCHYIKIDADVHGGLTYAGFNLVVFDKPIEGFWIGFDCSHSGDLVPTLMRLLQKDLEKYPNSALIKRYSTSTYRNMEYVINQCKTLAQQAKEAMEKTHEST